MDMIQTLAQELNKDPRHVENVVRLLDEGNTIPFIARYRKELHGAMDDTSLRTLEERLQYLRGLEERRDTVKKSIEEQGKLTEELAAAIDSAQTLAEVEDLYRPYKQKRRTRATVAREKGLEPLAALLFAQERDCPRPEDAAAGFIDSEKGVETAADALQGANDIIAEWISDDAAVRKSLRELLERRGTLRSLAATEEDSVYRLYYNFEQSLSRLQGHQILAINRGEKEEKLKVTVLLDRELALPLLRRAVVKPGSAAMEFVKGAAEDAYDRLIYPSLEREMRAALTDRADEGAIGQFALNLKPLLMQPPVKGKVTMGLDPGYRMGCKVAVVDGTGKVTGHSEGTASITACNERGEKTACLVTVRKSTAARPVLNTTELALTITEQEPAPSAQLKLEQNNRGFIYVRQWVSSSPSVAQVSSSGTVTGQSSGRAVISALTTAGQVLRCTVTVTSEIGRVRMSKNAMLLQAVGASQKLTAQVAGGKNTAMTWLSSNPDVAQVSTDGTVTAVGDGETVILAVSPEGRADACYVAVGTAAWRYRSEEELAEVLTVSGQLPYSDGK